MDSVLFEAGDPSPRRNVALYNTLIPSFDGKILTRRLIGDEGLAAPGQRLSSPSMPTSYGAEKGGVVYVHMKAVSKKSLY